MNTLQLISFATCCFISFGIGANNAGNAVGTVVGSRALKIRAALLLAAFAELLGGIFGARHVSNTIRKGIVDPELYKSSKMDYALGMLAAQVGATLWLCITTFVSVPVSTTHAIVGGIVSFGLFTKGFAAINWNMLKFVSAAWVASPFIGFVVGSLCYYILIDRFLLHSKSPSKEVISQAPFHVSFVVAFAVFIMGEMGIPGILHSVGVSLRIPSISFLILGLISGYFSYQWSYKLVRRLNQPNFSQVSLSANKSREASLEEGLKESNSPNLDQKTVFLEKLEIKESPLRHSVQIFQILQIVAAALVAFSHCAQDLPNATGPLSGILYITNPIDYVFPFKYTLIAALFLSFGLIVMGQRMSDTVGSNITPLSPSGGYIVMLSTAVICVLASRLSLPISTTHVLIGSVTGVGFTTLGLSAINWKTIRNIVTSWVVTLPVSGFTTLVVFVILRLFSW